MVTGALLKETNGTWLLNANLKIWHDTVFHINRTDTEWLKINSTGSQEPLHIHVIGDMIVDSVKITHGILYPITIA